MNRRHFIGALAAAAAGSVLDPERLLWVPGKKKIFLPSPQQSIIGVDFAAGPDTSVVMFKAGDIITIEGMYRGDYQAYARSDQAPRVVQHFRVTEDVKDATVNIESLNPYPGYDFRPLKAREYTHKPQLEGPYGWDDGWKHVRRG